MSAWELITTATQAVSSSSLTANFTNVPFADVAFFAIVFNGKAASSGQDSYCRIGTSSGVITSSDYDVESFIISGGSSAGVSYHQETNKSFWHIENSNMGNYSSAIMYVGLDFYNSNHPLCFMKLSSETSCCQMSGWLDTSLVSLGEVQWEAGTGDVEADSYMSIYKVLSS